MDNFRPSHPMKLAVWDSLTSTVRSLIDGEEGAGKTGEGLYKSRI